MLSCACQTAGLINRCSPPDTFAYGEASPIGKPHVANTGEVPGLLLYKFPSEILLTGLARAENSVAARGACG